MKSVHVTPPFPVLDRPLRLLLVSDTHGIVDPRIVALVARSDALVHAGDIGAESVLQQLRPGSGLLYAVRGNNDVPEKWPSDERAIVLRLPDEIVLDLPGGSLVVVHGDKVLPAGRRHAELRRRYPFARAIVYGHTHRSVCDRASQPWVVNPGAAGRTRTFGGASCLLLSVQSRRWHVRLFRFSLAVGSPSPQAKGLPSRAGKD